MKDHMIHISKILNTRDLEDILCSCIEGGCNYWAMIDNSTKTFEQAHNEIKAETDQTPTIEEVMIHIWENGDEIIFYEDDDEDGNFDIPHIVTLERFLHGIEVSIANGDWDGGEIDEVDGMVGDAIMQYAIFDELVYG